MQNRLRLMETGILNPLAQWRHMVPDILVFNSLNNGLSPVVIKLNESKNVVCKILVI